jgi:hypothetical protein
VEFIAVGQVEAARRTGLTERTVRKSISGQRPVRTRSPWRFESIDSAKESA